LYAFKFYFGTLRFPLDAVDKNAAKTLNLTGGYPCDF